MANPNPTHKWTKGNAPGLGSKLQGLFTYEALQRIASDVLQEYTRQELLDLHKDTKRYGKLPVVKTLVIDRIIGAMGAAGGPDFDRIFDRVIGKAAQSVKVTHEVSLVDMVANANKLKELNPPVLDAVAVTIEQAIDNNKDISSQSEVIIPSDAK